jgi:hypothetical protein
MGSTAKGSFDLTGWEPTPWDEVDGVVLARATVTKAFHGDAEGSTSVAELVLVSRDGDGLAYGGLERFTGSLAGRKGTFVLHHDANADPDTGWFRWSIVPGTGTGELAGIRGTGVITRHDDGRHDYTFDYDLD